MRYSFLIEQYQIWKDVHMNGISKIIYNHKDLIYQIFMKSGVYSITLEIIEPNEIIIL